MTLKDTPQSELLVMAAPLVLCSSWASCFVYRVENTPLSYTDTHLRARNKYDVNLWNCAAANKSANHTIQTTWCSAVVSGVG